MTREEDENPPPPGPEVPNRLLGKSRGQLIMAPERITQLGHRGKDNQLWMHPVVKVKSNAVKQRTGVSANSRT